tara:strand:- start:270 stop:464 length:195 start_codon:yes stop_codon:yes gene_type:complete
MKKPLVLAVVGFCFLAFSFGLLIVGATFEPNEPGEKLFSFVFTAGCLLSLGWLFGSIETTQPKK